MKIDKDKIWFVNMINKIEPPQLDYQEKKFKNKPKLPI